MSQPTRLVVGAVVVEGGRALVICRSADRRLFPNGWDIPGGHVELAETDEQALACRRVGMGSLELSEETGWKLTAIRGSLGEEHWHDPDGLERVERDFLVQVERDLERPVLELDKHPEAGRLAATELVVLLERRPGGDLIHRVARPAWTWPAT